MRKIKEFNSKITGNTFIDGGQSLLRKLQQGELLKYIPEPENPYDANAIALYTLQDYKLGYIPKETAKGLQDELKRGYGLKIEVSVVTGGGDKTYGCNILIQVWDNDGEVDTPIQEQTDNELF